MKAFKFMSYKCNKADPCMTFKWVDSHLVLWIIWVDDCLNAGLDQEVRKAVKEMHLMFECKDLGMLEEYVGCKIKHECDKGWMKLTQQVLLQSYEDEFELNQHGLKPHTPAEMGSVLEREDGDEVLSKKEHSKYLTGINKLLHMSRWKRPEM
eukprot:6224370-Ditylum_brightwellii.AAC.1